MHKIKVVPRVTVRGMRVPKSIGDVKDFALKYYTYAKILLKYHNSYDYEHASCHTMNMVAFKISHLQIPNFSNTTPNVCKH